MTAVRRAVTTDQVHVFVQPLDDVWAAITSTDRYQTWWPWLRSFDGRDFTGGSTWTCTVRSPLGYTVRFQVRLGQVEPPAETGRGDAAGVVTAIVSGDIAGGATVTVTSEPGGTRLRIASDLTPVRPLLRRLSRVAPPLTRWGHDRVMRSGIRRFRAGAF